MFEEAAVEPLRPVEFEVLLTLSGEDSHGFGIIQATEARTEGELVLDTATLYRALRRMLAAEWIREVEDPDDASERRRRVYSITDQGRAVARAEARRMASLVRAAVERRVLASGDG